MLANASLAESLASLPIPDRNRILKDLTRAEAEALEFDWRFWGRPKQFAPPGLWNTWLIIAGRGFGKTRTGSEWVRENVCGSTPLGPGRFKHVALVAETAADARDVIVGDGKMASDPTAGSGILQVHPRDFRPIYEPSKRRLTWPNGAIATLYNGTEPEQLRGPEHDGAWCDELAKYRYGQDTWDMLQFGLRLGAAPQALITTTPKPIKLLKTIRLDPGTVVTRGKTSENAVNLAPSFLSTLQRRYGGTRLGRQELDAEELDDVPGALWTRDVLDRLRVSAVTVTLVRIVVAIDPGVSTGENADETGIIVMGKGSDDRGYLLADLSGVHTPAEWARLAIQAYHLYGADRVVGEANNGGDMIEHTLRVYDPAVAFTKVFATRGKAVRAEPVAGLYEKDRVSHVGAFPELEDQMCAFTRDFDRTKAGYSPDRMDALVWAGTELFIGDTGFAFGSI